MLSFQEREKRREGAVFQEREGCSFEREGGNDEKEEYLKSPQLTVLFTQFTLMFERSEKQEKKGENNLKNKKKSFFDPSSPLYFLPLFPFASLLVFQEREPFFRERKRKRERHLSLM